MGFFSDDPPVRESNGAFEMKCNLKKPGTQKKCDHKLRANSKPAVKDLWKDHKRWHDREQKAHIRSLRSKYSDKVAELVAEYESIDKVPKSKFSGLHTKNIPNVPNGQNVNGIVYDNDGKRVPYETLKRYVQGWE